MLTFEQLYEKSGADQEAVKKALKKMKKGDSLSFTDSKTGKTVTGSFTGIKRMGGRSFAGVEVPGEGSVMVPFFQVQL